MPPTDAPKPDESKLICLYSSQEAAQLPVCRHFHPSSTHVIYLRRRIGNESEDQCYIIRVRKELRGRHNDSSGSMESMDFMGAYHATSTLTISNTNHVPWSSGNRFKVAPFLIPVRTFFWPRLKKSIQMEKSWGGTRVFYWGSDSQIRYGTVLQSTRMPDGTQVFIIKPDNGETVSLPAAGVTVVGSEGFDHPPRL